MGRVVGGGEGEGEGEGGGGVRVMMLLEPVRERIPHRK